MKIKAVEGYEGKYLITEFGDVFSLKRNIKLKSHSDGRGYQMVYLHKDGKQHTRKIHRIMAKAFLNTEKEINHVDGNKENNRLENLEITTHSRNMRHAITSGLRKVKLNGEDIQKIKFLYATGKYRYKDLGKIFKVHAMYVGQIIRGERGVAWI